MNEFNRNNFTKWKIKQNIALQVFGNRMKNILNTKKIKRKNEKRADENFSGLPF